MSMPDDIPDEWRARSPLMTAEGWRNLQRLRQHAHAPRWNFETGDRLVEGDLELVDLFREQLAERDDLPSARPTPPEAMLDAIAALRTRSWYVERQLRGGCDLRRDWHALPTMSRDDLATRLWEVVPHDIRDLTRLIGYDTSGTSGHAVVVPHDPVVLARHHTFAELAMRWHGAAPDFSPTTVGCLNLCAQRSTYVFASVFNVWNQTGFVKVNLAEHDWAGGRDAARAYLTDLDAQLLTSDPVSLTEAMRWGLDVRPRAILSTALALTPDLRRELSSWTAGSAPLIDWYSTTETGPIACSHPAHDDLEILAHDLFVEVLDDRGHPVPDGELGEVVVTVLRNPYLPLVRYRTGDYARLIRDATGDPGSTPTPRLRDLHGRAPVYFRAADGGVVSSVDIGRTMRLGAAFAQHAFTQHTDGTCTVRLRPIPGVPIDTSRVADLLGRLLGHNVTVVRDDELGRDGKPDAYRREGF